MSKGYCLHQKIEVLGRNNGVYYITTKTFRELITQQNRVLYRPDTIPSRASSTLSLASGHASAWNAIYRKMVENMQESIHEALEACEVLHPWGCCILRFH